MWVDVSKPVVKSEADIIWNEKTEHGTKCAQFEDIDYYRIFSADTKMIYS